LPFVSSPPDFEEAVKTNVFIGKFIDETFHVEGCVRACIPWKFIDTPPVRTTAIGSAY